MAILPVLFCLWSYGTCLPAIYPMTVAAEQSEHRGSGVELHRPDGTAIYVNPHAIAFVREPLPGEIGNAMISFANGGKQATQETVAEIIEALEQDRPRGPQ